MASVEPRPTSGARVRRWAVAAALLLVPAVILRSCVVSTYRIGSPSMEPALLTGDELIVLLAEVDPDLPRRWDVALFDDDIDAEVPEDIDAVVKRIVGMPGEFFRLLDGDVWVGESRDDLSLVRKPDQLVRGLLVPVSRTAGLGLPWAGPASAVSSASAGGTRLTAGGQEVLFFAQPVMDGMLGSEGESVVADTALEVVVGEGTGALVLRLREGADTFVARLATAARGGAALHHNLGGGEVASQAAFEGLSAGQRVLFWNVDNGVRLFVDEDLLLSYDYALNADQTPGTNLNNVPGIGVADGSIELREVTILRDLHYGPQGKYGTSPAGGLSPCKILDDQYFVLGDLSHRSHDSRHFGPVSRDLLLGRPLARFRPWNRAALLDRWCLSR